MALRSPFQQFKQTCRCGSDRFFVGSMCEGCWARAIADTLEEHLVLWAATNNPEAFAALAQSNDAEWWRRCLAAIFRARAFRDPAWMYKAVERWPGEVLALPIGRAAGFAVTPQWVESIRALAGEKTHEDEFEIELPATPAPAPKREAEVLLF